MNLNPLLLFLLLLLSEMIAFGQQHNFTNYSVAEGVAQSQIPTILEDQKGYLWLGTSGGGLNQFDGQNFTTYTTQNGLKSNYIQTLFEDSKGVIWVGTSNGINQIKEGIIIDFETPKQLIVNDFIETKTGIIWLATNQGLYKINDNQLVTFESNKFSTSLFTTIYEHDNQTIWVGGAQGLYKINDNQVTEIKGPNRNSLKDLRDITATHEGVLWIAAYNQGVFLADNQRIVRQLTQIDGLNSTKIAVINITKTGTIWLGTTDKGVIIRPANTRKSSLLSVQQGLPNNHIQSIIEDSWGNIWMGTSGGGLSKYNGQQFEHFTLTEGLKGNFIRALEVDNKGRLWVSTSGKGVQIYENGTFSGFAESSDLLNTTCPSIFEDRLGHIWIGTDQGVTVFLDSLLLTFNRDNGLTGNFITNITQDTLGHIWVASEGGGVTKITWNDLQPSQSTFTQFTTKNGLISNQINDLHVDLKNRLWVATNGGGIALIEADQISQTFTKKKGLKENVIRSFSEDDLGFLWYGTASFGIGNIQLYQPDFPVNNQYHQLASNNIKLLQTDETNNLWVGSEKGVSYLKLDAARNVLSQDFFSRREGFKGVETTLNTVLKDDKNNLWFGTVNGLTKFNKAIQKGQDYPPKLFLKSVKLGTKNLQDTPFANWLTNWTNLQLNHDQNELSFTVSALHLSYPKDIQYQWHLEGKEGNWTTPSATAQTYQRTFLPGKYALKVRAITNRENLYSPILTFPFEISPPFWQSWWFRLTALLSGLLLIGLFIKWRIYLVQKRAKRVQNRLELDKKLLELEQKALQLQMNPHFIFNALNSIQGAITPTDIKTARLQLAKFSKLMRATLEHARSDAILLEEEINTLTNYLSLEQFSQGNTFDYTIEVADNLDETEITLPTMILQPFVENAIIHGVAHLAQKRGKIKVAFTRKGKRLQCIIEDNGVGRIKAEQLKSQIGQVHQSAALTITRERLNLLRSGKAAKNSLQIVDLKDSEGNALGTRVEVILPIEE